MQKHNNNIELNGRLFTLFPMKLYTSRNRILLFAPYHHRPPPPPTSGHFKGDISPTNNSSGHIKEQWVGSVYNCVACAPHPLANYGYRQELRLELIQIGHRSIGNQIRTLKTNLLIRISTESWLAPHAHGAMVLLSQSVAHINYVCYNH